MGYKGNICEKCEVEITVSKVRRERMGHIELASPVAHIWFLRSLPSRICTILNVPLKEVEKVLYYDSYIITNPGLTNFSCRELVSEEDYFKAVEKYGVNNFSAEVGATAIKNMLKNVDL